MWWGVLWSVRTATSLPGRPLSLMVESSSRKHTQKLKQIYNFGYQENHFAQPKIKTSTQPVPQDTTYRHFAQLNTNHRSSMSPPKGRYSLLLCRYGVEHEGEGWHRSPHLYWRGMAALVTPVCAHPQVKSQEEFGWCKMYGRLPRAESGWLGR